MLLSNYLFFTTACEPALAFYTQCGLGRVVAMARYGEGGAPVKNPAMRGRVMHAKFEGPGVLFFASDNDDAEPMRGSAHFLQTEIASRPKRCLPGSPQAASSRRRSASNRGGFLRQADRSVRRAMDDERPRVTRTPPSPRRDSDPRP